MIEENDVAGKKNTPEKLRKKLCNRPGRGEWTVRRIKKTSCRRITTNKESMQNRGRQSEPIFEVTENKCLPLR